MTIATRPQTAKFELGKVLATPGAIDAFNQEAEAEWLSVLLRKQILERHKNGDWGDLGDEDKQRNDEALNDGSRIFSAYILPNTQVKIWLITEANRSATTFLLPSEY